MDRNKLPVEIMDKELPYDSNGKYREFSNRDDSNNGGFANFILLVSLMAVCFMWGMLIVVMR